MNVIRDAFGTRFDAEELLAGIHAQGLENVRLVAENEGITLECPDPDIRREDVARALTWLRGRLSPLVPVRTERLAEARDGGAFVDRRSRPAWAVFLAEVTDPRAGLPPAVDDLLRRLGPIEEGPPGGVVPLPPIEEALRGGLARELAALLNGRLPAPARATISALVPARQGLQVVGPAATGAAGRGPHFLVWFRPGGEQGARPAALIAASISLPALDWLGRALSDRPLPEPGAEIVLDGLAWKAARRPVLAVLPSGPSPIQVDPARCTSCGACASICPEGFLDTSGRPVEGRSCTRCYECVDACPTDALRPTAAADTATLASALAHRPGWLSRLAGLPGPSFPAPFPPSYLAPRKTGHAKPKYVLGLAIMTMQEHAAVLLRDGEIVGAVEQERLVRVRHAGWHPPDRPGVTVAMDPTLCLEEAFCRRPIRALLEKEGITLDDIDLFVVNGLHGRHAGAISFTDPTVPIPTVRAGRVVYLPHHLAHAASAFRASGFKSAWIVTVDGRGDRECAAIWRADEGHIRPIDTILSLTDRSIGGVYEGFTRLLGFGSHGQGSVMALASFGRPTQDLDDLLSLKGGTHIHESAVDERFAALRRNPSDPLGQEHKDLAASLQAALETTVVELLRRHVGDGPLDALCLGGGVALNCRMNETLRRTFQPREMFVQPGANDAGTALGAALEAWADQGGAPSAPMTHPYLGPAFDDAQIEPVLKRSGFAYRKVESIARETAARLVDGQVVCWFQGRMELGPRALGARSLLADPRRPEIHGRVNGLKQRESWRPFGPSILAGHENEWLERAFDARFMLFTLPVRKEQRSRVPAVVHVDGTTRPQVVHAETAPLYHGMISEFFRLSGVPMVLNTSFNRRGEPIVCTPADAIESFRALGADALAIGNFLVEREAAPVPAVDEAALSSRPGGRRLSLRLTSACDLQCGHCPVRDLEGHPDRSFGTALRSLAEGREAGCDELVILRGEAALRDDLPRLVAAARRMGYRFVQLQTNANALANPRVREALLSSGIDSFEAMLLAADEGVHDELAGTPGSFRGVVQGIRALAALGRQLLVTVPVLAGNLRSLGSTVALTQKLGAKRIQFNFPRPVELKDRVVTAPIPRLGHAAPFVRQAAKLAQQLGLAVTTEAIPFCHLPPELRTGGETAQDWSRHRVDDFHVLHESADAVRATQRPELPPCRTCSARDKCPRTWALYLELFGSGELTPL